jgi:Uma2 family endonuclease
MGEMLVKERLTGDDLLRMGEDATTGYELIEGELVKMSPVGFDHGRSEFRVGFHLIMWNDKHQLGQISGGEAGFYTRKDSNTVRAADVTYISNSRLAEAGSTEGYLRIPPDLVVEVISPGNTAEEIEVKTQEWFDFGVRMVWLVYPKTRRVHVYTTPDRSILLNADDTLEGGDVLPGFSVKVSAFFER